MHLPSRTSVAFCLGLFLHFAQISCCTAQPVLPNTTFEVESEENEISCDPLFATDTAVLCFPPAEASNGDFKNATDCSERLLPGTVASYSCRNFRGVVYSGFLKCTNSGVWIISLSLANNSLCNLDAAIVNFEMPDVVLATEEPEFTTPPSGKSVSDDYEATALRLHNVFRKNHGVPFVKMSKQLNKMVQALTESIASGEDLKDIDAKLKLNPIHRTTNIEMNWYFQVPPSPSKVISVSNAIQSWYAGFGKYDWENVEKVLDVGDALAFARVVWKATQLLGVGVSTTENFTFVACAYTPGRNVESIDPVNELKKNVLPFVVG